MKNQFILFTFLVFFTGLFLGILRIVIPVLEREQGLSAELSILLPLVAFGFVKGGFNFLAGRLSDVMGRKRLQIMGWIVALIASLVLVIWINPIIVIMVTILLAVNQALTWTTSVTSQIDLSGKSRAGLATGINEMSGYLGVALGNIVASREYSVSMFIILGISVIALLTSLFVMETKKLIRDPPTKESYREITPISVIGLVEKFVDSSFFVVIPIYLLIRGYSLVYVGELTAVYTLTWSLSQPLFGYLADNFSRATIVSLGLTLMFAGFVNFLLSPLFFSFIEGIGMGMIYPNLIALVNDRVGEGSRGKALGYYRLYRDSGYGVAGLLLPFLYAQAGFSTTLFIVGLLQVVLIPFLFRRRKKVPVQS
ncbi:MFS transporter [Metallosphaera javensis (ex Sakai et al. 2022)]|uniref:MFS transporter n=1 Tax=Metallosphaera javensis (ex Sakai et al. 2022) TaxID=2775498 RepID=UPI0025906B4A|nr:MAG: MFS transporter [Metallosphaera javensis (ex Sakai et al. 2022)]